MLYSTRHRTVHTDEAGSISDGINQNSRMLLDLCNSYAAGIGIHIFRGGRDHGPENGNAGGEAGENRRIDIV